MAFLATLTFPTFFEPGGWSRRPWRAREKRGAPCGSAGVMAQIGNGSSEQVQRACAYLDTTLAGRTLPQNVKDKCAKLRTLVSSVDR